MVVCILTVAVLVGLAVLAGVMVAIRIFDPPAVLTQNAQRMQNAQAQQQPQAHDVVKTMLVVQLADAKVVTDTLTANGFPNVTKWARELVEYASRASTKAEFEKNVLPRLKNTYRMTNDEASWLMQILEDPFTPLPKVP